MDLAREVKNKIATLGVKEAAKHFGVSTGTISNWANGKTPPTLQAGQMVLDSTMRGEAFWCTSDQEVSLPIPVGEEPKWDGRKVHILLPVYRSFCADTHYTLFANYAKYGPEKIAMSMEKRTVIHESRNTLTHKGLQTEAEWFIMCDDDMILPCGSPGIINGKYGGNLPEPSASFNAITRIMSHGPQYLIVGGLYFGRHGHGMAQCHLGFEQPHESDNLRKFRHTQLLPMGWVGTGFIRIHRSVFETLKKEIDGGRWPECKPVAEGKPYGFWNPIKAGVGEDVSFGRRCSEIGIPSHLDPLLVCLHQGERNYGPSNTTNRT